MRRSLGLMAVASFLAISAPVYAGAPAEISAAQCRPQFGDLFGGSKEEKVEDHWNPPVDEEEQKRINKNYKKTIVQGAVLGGAIGFVGSKIFGLGDTETALITAGTAALGGVIAEKYANKFEKLSQDKKKTEKQIVSLEKNNEALQLSLDAVEQNIEYISSEIAILEQQLKRGAIKQAELDAFRDQAQAELARSTETLDRSKLTYAEAQETLAAVKRSSDQEVLAFQERAEQIAANLEKKNNRAEGMRKDVSGALARIGRENAEGQA